MFREPRASILEAQKQAVLFTGTTPILRLSSIHWAFDLFFGILSTRHHIWVYTLVTCWGYIFSLGFGCSLSLNRLFRCQSPFPLCQLLAQLPTSWNLSFPTLGFFRDSYFWPTLDVGITSCQTTWHSTWQFKSLSENWIILNTCVVFLNWQNFLSSHGLYHTVPHCAQF